MSLHQQQPPSLSNKSSSSSKSNSGFASYSPISTLERQSVTPGQRWMVFVRTNVSCYVEGGVERILKLSSRGGGANAADQHLNLNQQSQATIAMDSDSNPFSFLGEDTTNASTSFTTTTTATSSGGGGGGVKVGSFFKKVAQGATSSIERSIHNLAIRADQGRNRDLLVVGLYNAATDALLSMTESQPLPEQPSDIRFVVPLVVPGLGLGSESANEYNSSSTLTIKLWIRSGAALLQSAKANKNFLLASTQIHVNTFFPAVFNSSSKGSWCAVVEQPVQSAVLVGGALTLTVTKDLKFPPLCGLGWSLADPIPNPKSIVASRLYNLPLDQSYGWSLNSNLNNSIKKHKLHVIATERSIESTLVLPMASAWTKLASSACLQSLEHAKSVQRLVQARQIDTPVGEYMDCNVQIHSIQLRDPSLASSLAAVVASANTAVPGTTTSTSTDASMSPIMVSTFWQRPDSIFEVELTKPQPLAMRFPEATTTTTTPITTTTSPSYTNGFINYNNNNDINSMDNSTHYNNNNNNNNNTNMISFRFFPKPCRTWVLPSFLKTHGQRLGPCGFLLGNLRLQILIKVPKRDGTSALTTTTTSLVVPQNPFDSIASTLTAAAPSSIRDLVTYDTIVLESVIELEEALLVGSITSSNDQMTIRHMPVMDPLSRLQLGTIAVAITMVHKLQDSSNINNNVNNNVNNKDDDSDSYFKSYTPATDGLVSLVGLANLCPSVLPPLDFEATDAATNSHLVFPDAVAQRQHLQLMTMGTFVTAPYLRQHIAAIREMDAKLLAERAHAYQQALTLPPPPSDENNNSSILNEYYGVPHQDKSPKPFRPSSSRTTVLLSGIPFNVHTTSLSVMLVDSPTSAPQQQQQQQQQPIGDVFYNTTCGAPADHARDFGNIFSSASTGAGSSSSFDPNNSLVSPVGPVSGGLRRLEIKRQELASCVIDLQAQLVAAIGSFFQTQRQKMDPAGASHLTHVPCHHPQIQTLRTKLYEAVQALHHVTWNCAVRRANVFSQALGIALTTYLASVSDPNKIQSTWPDLWAKHGYLVSFEGLLSSAGKELGMIEDASVGIGMLRMVQVVFVRDDGGQLPSSSSASSSTTRTPVPLSPYIKWIDLSSSPTTITTSGTGNRQLTLQIGIIASYYDQRIPLALRNNVPVRFCSILFEVGVDIRQWGANAGSNVLSQLASERSSSELPAPEAPGGGAGLIDDEDDDVGVRDDDVLVQLNYEGFRLLNAYAHLISPANSQQSMAAQQRGIHPLLEKLHQHIVSSAGKMNHDILDEAALLARQMGGGGVVFCKSGKDRTAMHVTFKQAQFECQYRESVAPTTYENDSTRTASTRTILEDAALLRTYGTRLPICEKNVGQAKYAFNSLQVKFMPEALKPPMSTLAGFLKGGKVFSGGIES